MPDEPRDLSELTLEIAATLFAGTVLDLATTEGSLRDRIFDAYGGVTMEVMRFADQLPVSFADRIRELHAELTGGARGSEGEVRAGLRRTLDAMPGRELVDVARRICFLADDLTFVAVRENAVPVGMD